MECLDPKEIRKLILEMAYKGQSVHIGCAFSMVEITCMLFNKYFDLQKFKSNHTDRNYLCVSKGHGVMAFYAALSKFGIISKENLDNYFKDGTLLTGLADSHVEGIEVSGGSLGQGITIATGMALGKKLNNSSSKVFCIVGDGEINEGSVWESFLIAAHHALSNLIVIVDANGFQAMGPCAEILHFKSISEKFIAFGFETALIDGHNDNELDNAFTQLLSSTSCKPKAIIANTVKGKGVSFMENDNIWHYTRLTNETYLKALAELK